MNVYLFEIPHCVRNDGNGEGGVPREMPDWRNSANQRFLIHIIPKTGVIEN
jgi:hypothetical protein